MKRVYMQCYCVVKKCTVHTPTSIRARTDFKFESLYIIETKCVNEFDMLNVLCEEKSM